MYLYAKGVNKIFSHIAEQHWEKLKHEKTNRKGNLVYGRYSIIKRVEAYRTNTDGSQIFFNDLADNGYSLLKKIILGKPQELKNIIDLFETNFANGRYPPLTQIVNGASQPSIFSKYVQDVFNYGGFSKKRRYWCAYDLCEIVGIDVCPYCNRNYTFTLKAKDNGVVRPELDHFLPKNEFPYLALSFYNLIPSCHICNSNLKHAHPFDLENYLHPYLMSLDEVVRFSIKFKNKTILKKEDLLKHYGVGFFYGDNKAFQIVMKSRTTHKAHLKKALRNIRVFRIRELYNRHKDLVQEIIQSTFIYNEGYIQSLLDDYKGLLFRNREDVLRHITRNYPDPAQMPNRPFSKLSKDIYEEFGIKF
jgi:hypothetical protein